MTNSNAPRLLVMAGGTGGHVFPALAVARHLRDQGWEVLWLGTEERMEARLVPQHGFRIRFIDIKGVRGNSLWRKVSSPFQILKAIIQSNRIMSKFRPDVVLGMGGYAAGPGGIAAWLRRTPLVLHEQNAVAGATNKILAKFATQVLVAFDKVLPSEIKVGNPVRAELVELGNNKPVEAKGPFKVLIVGGSLGAKVLNETLPAAVALMSSKLPLTLWHQVGRGNKDKVASSWSAQAPGVGVQVAEFIDDMAAAYEWADLVICRAGALTVAELAATGRPSILVPFPHAVDDHQTQNAQALVDAGAARILQQKNMTPESLAEEIKALVTEPERLVAMGQAARESMAHDATDKVASICQKLVRRR